MAGCILKTVVLCEIITGFCFRQEVECAIIPQGSRETLIIIISPGGSRAARAVAVDFRGDTTIHISR